MRAKSILTLSVYHLAMLFVHCLDQKNICKCFGHISTSDALIVIKKKTPETRSNLQLNAANLVPLALVV